MCLRDFQRGEGAFAWDEDPGGKELLGIISCAGCPTLAAPEKILHRIKPLADLGAQTIYLSSCMLALCPFKEKYKKLIEASFPGIAVVEGTHLPPEGVSLEEAGRQFKGAAHEMLCARRPSMSDVALALCPEVFAAPEGRASGGP
jgi:predicted metal-binding protein